ncbi:hypothetical protein [Streptomyces sp. NPDC004579]|uniref:hypothetical protein n=1 Tax=Streptomyces sp. NPDC004579 TaxID=3154667 RepID=UPI0033A21E52
MNPEAAAEARLQVALAAALGHGWHTPGETNEHKRHITAFLTHDSGMWAMFLPVPPGGVVALAAGHEDGRVRQTEPYTPDLDGYTDLYAWMATADLREAAGAMAAAIRKVVT